MGIPRAHLGVPVVAAVVAFGLGLAGPVAASGTPERPADRHCVVEVERIVDDVLMTGPEVCFETEGEADAYGRSHVFPSFSILTTTIGKHYTSTGYGGSSITIIGTTCAGGVRYPTGSWDNNIESSRHYCGGLPTTFYDSSNCSTGAYPIYSQASSLGWMNNRASCVRYG